MNWSGYYALALFAAVYPVMLAIVALFLSRAGRTRLLAGLLTGAFLTTMVFGIIVVSVVGSTDALTGSNKATVQGWVNIAIGTVLIVAAANLLVFHRSLRRKHAGEAEAEKKEKPSGWTARAGTADSFWAAFIIGIAIDLPSVWFLAALKYLIDAKFSTAVVFLLLLSYAAIAYISIALSLLFSLKWPERTNQIVQSSNAWLKRHERVIAGAIAGGIGIWQLAEGISKLP